MRDRSANERRPRRPKSATRASTDRRTLEKCRRRDRRATDPCCCCYRYRYTETDSRPCAVVCRDERTTSPRTREACPDVGVPSPRAGWTSRVVSLTASRLGVPAHNLKARAGTRGPEHRALLSAGLLFAGNDRNEFVHRRLSYVLVIYALGDR